MKAEVKRALALFLCVVMCGGMFPVVAFAEEEVLAEVVTEDAEVSVEAELPTETETAEEPEEPEISVIEDEEKSAIAVENAAETEKIALDGSVIASGTCGDDLTWSLTEDGTMTISGTGAMYDYVSDSSIDVEPSGWSIPLTSAPWVEYRESIKRLVINTDVTGIGNYAFLGCVNLVEIIINSNITSIGKYAFTYSAAKSIHLPDSLVSIGAGAFQDCHNLTDINIPTDLTKIESSVFAMCSSLERIVLPEGVTSIGSSAFFGTNLQTFHFPASLNEWNLPGTIKEITVSEGNKHYSAIDGVLFNKAKDTLRWFPRGKSLECTEYTVPSSVSMIDSMAFSSCSGLKSIVIPNNVSYIGGWAFSGCSGLTDVYFIGTEEQWNAISFGQFNDPLLNAAIHYNAAPSATPGDVTGDSDVTIADVVRLNQAVLGKVTLSEKEKESGDVTHDGDITIADVVRVNQFVLGRIKSFEE